MIPCASCGTSVAERYFFFRNCFASASETTRYRHCHDVYRKGVPPSLSVSFAWTMNFVLTGWRCRMFDEHSTFMSRENPLPEGSPRAW